MSGTPERTRYCSRCLTTFPADVPKCPNLGCRSGRPAIGWGELLDAGEVIDRTYRIHARLAIGGAGVTYLGGELGADGVSEVGPRVAIKVLYQQRDQGSYLRRLSTEAQILQGLNHPQIVECRGFVHRAGHSPYLVTRYEEGGSLLDHIRRVGTLPIPVVAALGRQVCWALDVAHRQGVVHRDLKPENVLLVREVPADHVPEIRVADFGIAKVYGAMGDRLTRVGAFVGTPQYAAPEQFDGLSPEPATDVYAVGALLYFCIAARPVADFMAELDPDSQRDHLVRHLPPRLEPAHGSPELRRWMEDTLAVAMAVDPGDRCDITQLETRLASIQEGRDPGFVRLPPAGSVVPGARTIGVAEAATSADTLDTSHVRPLVTDDLLGLAEPGSGAGGVGAVGAVGVGAVGVGAARPSGPPPVPPLGAPLSSGPPPVPPLPTVSGASAGSGPAVPALSVPPSLSGQAVPPVSAVQPVASVGGGGARPVDGGAVRPFDGAAVRPADTTTAPPIPRDAGGVAAVRTAPVRAAPLRAAEPTRAPTRSRAAPIGCGLLAVGAGGVGLVALAVVAWVWVGAAPRVLTGAEAAPEDARDWQLVAGALGERGASAEIACGIARFLQVEAVIEGDGAVRSVKLLNYPHEPTRACIEAELKKAPFPRGGKGPVQVAVSLQK